MEEYLVPTAFGQAEFIEKKIPLYRPHLAHGIGKPRLWPT